MNLLSLSTTVTPVVTSEPGTNTVVTHAVTRIYACANTVVTPPVTWVVYTVSLLRNTSLPELARCVPRRDDSIHSNYFKHGYHTAPNHQGLLEQTQSHQPTVLYIGCVNKPIRTNPWDDTCW